MFIDASAIVAILGREPGYEELEKSLMAAASDALYVSPLVKFEASLALARQKATVAGQQAKPSPALLRQAAQAVDTFVEDLGAQEIPISPEIGKKPWRPALCMARSSDMPRISISEIALPMPAPRR